MNVNSREQSFEKVKQATLKIRNAAGKTIGTGFYVSPEGHFVTCAHVVEESGGVEAMTADDRRAISSLYVGNSSKDDIALLQIQNRISPAFLPIATNLQEQTFRCFGYSNESYEDGASVEGTIIGSAISTSPNLFNQKVLRLVTLSDTQAIEGGQSGAAICSYSQHRKEWQVVGVLVGAEGENGGVALPMFSIPQGLIPVRKAIDKQRIVILTGGLSTFVVITFLSAILFLPHQCSPEILQSWNDRIDKALEGNNLQDALDKTEEFQAICRNDVEPQIAKGSILLTRAIHTDSSNQADLDQAITIFRNVLGQQKGQNYPKAIYGLGTASYFKKDYKEAIQELEKLENSDNEDLKVKSRYFLGSSYQALKNYSAAIKYFEDILILLEDYQWNQKTKSNPLYNYYFQSFISLLEIKIKQWNQGIGTEKQDYFKQYQDYFERFLREAVLSEDRKKQLDEWAAVTSSNDIALSNLARTKEYKQMLCNFYKQFNLDEPSNLRLQCKG